MAKIPALGFVIPHPGHLWSCYNSVYHPVGHLEGEERMREAEKGLRKRNDAVDTEGSVRLATGLG